MGVKNAMPADEPIFDFYIETLNRLAPDAQWCAAGIGPAQLTVNEWAIAKGGHTRTGLEDNVRLDRDTLAPSNAALGAACGRSLRKIRTPRRHLATGARDPRSAKERCMTRPQDRAQ